MRVLVTNDDGIDSEGLEALVRRLAGEHELIIAAPSDDRSGMSSAVGPVEHGRRIRVQRRQVCGLPATAVEGPPALIVRAAMDGALGPPPEVVVSGVNPGYNTGGLLLHSGTYGAALTAATGGAIGIAVSAEAVAAGAAALASDLAGASLAVLADTAPRGLVVNLNVPPRAVGACQVSSGRQSTDRIGFVPEPEAWTIERGKHREPFAAGTEGAALAEGLVAVHLRTLYAPPWPGSADLISVLHRFCAG